MEVEKKLTSVHIIEDIYIQFKIKSIQSNLNLQKFVNRTIHLYNNDEEFRNKIDNYTKLAASGSKF